MKTTNTLSRKDEKGFTLVELAVVMIIIGLLIGGVLKGQELINNARVTATTSDFESYSAAYNGFIDKYSAVPGDMGDASTRLPASCDGGNCSNGTGNSRISINVGAENAADDEGGYFFAHLLAADFVSGFTGSDEETFGTTFPTAPVGGGYFVGDGRQGATGFTAGELTPNPYLVLIGTVGNTATGTGVLTPSQAARIDRKLDDGRPDGGVVVSQSGTSDCRSATDTYDEQSTSDVCVIGYRLQ